MHENVFQLRIKAEYKLLKHNSGELALGLGPAMIWSHQIFLKSKNAGGGWYLCRTQSEIITTSKQNGAQKPIPS